MVIRYSDGSYAEGVIQKLEGAVLRTAIAGVDDIVEFTLVRNQWISEAGNAVTFEFPISIQVDLADILPETLHERPGHCMVGGDCLLRRVSLTNGPAN